MAEFVGRSRRVHGAAAPSRFEKDKECPEMAVESPSAATPCGRARGELDLLPTADATTCPASRASSSLSVDVRFITRCSAILARLGPTVGEKEKAQIFFYYSGL